MATRQPQASTPGRSVGIQLISSKAHERASVGPHKARRLAHEEHFRRVGRRLRIPEQSIDLWISATDYPLHLFMMAQLSGFFFCLVTAVLLGPGSAASALPPWRCTLNYAAATLTVSGTLWLMYAAWTLGPDFRLVAPRASFGAFVVMVTPISAAYIPFMFGREELTPFGSRLLLTLTLVPWTGTHAVFMSATVLGWERGPRHTPPWRFLLSCLLKTMRNMDAASDCVYVRVLWERVRTRLHVLQLPLRQSLSTARL